MKFKKLCILSLLSISSILVQPWKEKSLEAKVHPVEGIILTTPVFLFFSSVLLSGAWRKPQGPTEEELKLLQSLAQQEARNQKLPPTDK